ncbi:MAG: type II toxin-antitoxin system death-on-curing family toxin [Chloroflexota bacterium]|nr:type II toxin-antitoxin system death-on-curing family toxin [Chloroflexota bacterium]
MSQRFPSLEEILAIHAALIDRFGGSPGIRDMGALEAALMRPQIGYYTDLIEEASALMESLAMNHPFVDGNKRVAFAGVDVFLRLNGHFIECEKEQAHNFFMRLFDTGAFNFEELKDWLQKHVKPLPG